MAVQTTRDRIVNEALRLFATHGYRGTSIAAIEGAAGLSPGAGGLYRHFSSKQHVLEAALASLTTGVAALDAAGSLLPLGDLRSELTLFARAGLAQIRASRAVLAVVERDGDLVAQVRMAAGDEIIGAGYRAAARLLENLLRAHDLPPAADSGAIAVLAVGSLANYVREAELYPDLEQLDENRIVTTWVECWHAYATASRP